MFLRVRSWESKCGSVGKTSSCGKGHSRERKIGQRLISQGIIALARMIANVIVAVGD